MGDEGLHHVIVARPFTLGILGVGKGQTEFLDAGPGVSEAVRAGDSLSAALDRLSFVPPVARQLIAAGEMSARLARMAERSAVLVENALSTERKRIAALLEPILMMAVGGFVLMVVLAVLLPIFDLQAMVTV
ncbi:type II secretion system F family protein [Ruegeria aquimaris]|uniref:Type II secretion system F family protein n=1 Tax=Ruegeria aquimaris TaxID=2984333 RepID=A0ABT3ARZ9_9RHOB|nr:type II secretion system F family protein [Ruegeria sp. XHP0148]MCV2891463.1 type II secretion system F family protein [Ruegeria sp. XHP0148]